MINQLKKEQEDSVKIEIEEEQKEDQSWQSTSTNRGERTREKKNYGQKFIKLWISIEQKYYIK